MAEINWSLLQPVDIGAKVQQGFAAGRSIVKEAQAQNALAGYLANPTDVQAQNALGYYAPEFGMQMAGQRASEQATRAAQEQERARMGTILTAPDPRQAALAAGDLDLATQISKLDEDKQKVVVARTKAAAPLAYQIRQEPDPARRKARLDAAKPYLLANGWTEQELNGFDVTNNDALDAIAATGRTVDQMIDDGKIIWHQAGEQPSFATDSMGRPVGSANPYKSAVPGTPVQPAAAGTPSNLQRFDDPGYQPIEASLEQEYGLPQGILAAIRTKGERSNAGEVSPAGARTVYQVIPSTREAFLQKYGIDAYASPQDAARVAALHLKESIERGGDPVREYVGGTDKANWGPQTRAYAERVGPVAAGPSARPATKADYDALPSGTHYIAPDGTSRVKP